jgi:hypothetical protein
MKYFHKKHFIILSTIIGFGIAIFSIWNSVQGKNVDRIVIQNKTRSLVVESVKPVTEPGEMSMFEITFKNKYDKPISVYRFRVADDLTGKDTISAVERDGLADGWTLKPNEVHSTRFSAAAKGKILLTIAAVLFEDGTGDGDTLDLTRLQEIRAGVWMAFNKIIPLMKESLETGPSLSIVSQIELLEKEISRLSDKDIPDNSRRGFVFARNYVGYELKDIRDNTQKTPGFSPVEKIAEKFNQFEATLAKLSVNLPAKIGNEGGQK